MTIVRLAQGLAIASLVLGSSTPVLRAQSVSVGTQTSGATLDPRQVVTISGQINNRGTGIWRTYANGAFDTATATEGFRVPSGKTFVLVSLDATLDAAETRPYVNLEIRILPLGTTSFPLARITFRNTAGIPSTASKTFEPGLVFAPGALVSIVDKGLKPNKFEVLLYGYYLP